MVIHFPLCSLVWPATGTLFRERENTIHRERGGQALGLTQPESEQLEFLLVRETKRVIDIGSIYKMPIYS
jgi:hypothetical protein